MTLLDLPDLFVYVSLSWPLNNMKKLLLIEDDIDTLSIMNYLTAELGIDVVARDRVIDLAEVENIMPDIIVLDHWIYEKMGGDLCFAVKKNPSTSHIPVLMVSAHQDLQRIATEKGADAYLEKPFNIDDFQYVIRKYI